MAPGSSVLLLFAVVHVAHVYCHYHGAYSHDSDIGGGNEEWMNGLVDTASISTLSLPGTHDTMADDNDGDLVDTQTLTLTKQLNAGIRVLDIRCTIWDVDRFDIYHGIYYLSANFDDVLTEIKNFLTAHPSEFVLMRVKEEGDSLLHSDPFDSVFASYFDSAAYQDYFYRPSSSTAVPSVADVRKKIVVLQNFVSSRVYGLDYGDGNKFSIQDDFALCQQSELYAKWLSVKSKLDSTNNDKSNSKFHINYLSGSMEGFGCPLIFPYFVASGHSSPGTSASRLSTGLTTLGCSDCYQEFPRTACAGWCTISYEGTNILAFDYMNSKSFVGIIMMDFPGKELIDRIITKNPFLFTEITVGGKCLEVAAFGTHNGANIQLWDCHGGDNQLWRVYDGGIVSKHSGKCLDVSQASTADGANIQLHEWNGGSNQKWKYLAHTDQFVSEQSNKCLDVEGAGTHNGANFHLWTCHTGWNQQFLFSEINAVADIVYTTIVVGGRCVDGGSGGDGANVYLWGCHGGDTQLWRFEGTQIILKSSEKCLDAAGGGSSDGTNVQMWGCGHDGWHPQAWSYNSNTAQIVNLHANKCLDVAGYGEDMYNGANLQLWGCHSDWDQHMDSSVSAKSPGLASLPQSLDGNAIDRGLSAQTITSAAIAALAALNVVCCIVNVSHFKKKKVQSYSSDDE